MMTMPALREPTLRRKSLWKFSGLDRRPAAADGAVREGRNLTAAALPCLAARAPREQIAAYDHPTDLIAARGKLAVIDGTNFLYDGAVRGQVSAGAHQMAVMGAKIVVFPEKAFYDIDSQVFGSLEATVSGAATFTDCTIELPGASVFRPGDGVTISGCADGDKNKTVVLRAVEGDVLTVAEGCFAPGAESAVTLTRAVPALDWVIEKDNRLWGTHDNCICCSVLGDPMNWNVFEGLAFDGWETAVGTDGPFTGAACLGSHLIFFKEDCVHKIYGAKPSNFQVQVSRLPGVLAGCPHGVLNVGERLYWWSRDGLIGYGGASAERLSEPLGEGSCTGAALGAMGHVLYVSLVHDGLPETLTYDLEQGAWMPEDGTRFTAFAALDRLVGLTAEGLFALSGGDEDFTWTVELGPFDMEDRESGLLNRLSVLAEFDAPGELVAELSFDDSPYRRVAARTVRRAGRVTVPLRLRRCGRFCIRLTLGRDATLRNVALLGRKGSGTPWQT